jgi:hypothetical protein
MLIFITHLMPLTPVGRYQVDEFKPERMLEKNFLALPVRHHPYSPSVIPCWFTEYACLA